MNNDHSRDQYGPSIEVDKKSISMKEFKRDTHGDRMDLHDVLSNKLEKNSHSLFPGVLRKYITSLLFIFTLSSCLFAQDNYLLSDRGFLEVQKSQPRIDKFKESVNTVSQEASDLASLGFISISHPLKQKKLTNDQQITNISDGITRLPQLMKQEIKYQVNNMNKIGSKIYLPNNTGDVIAGATGEALDLIITVITDENLFDYAFESVRK